MTPVTLDSDKNCVFKITDKDGQKIYVVQTDSYGRKRTQVLDLSSLVLAAPEA